MIIAEWKKIGYNYQSDHGGVAQRSEQRAHNLLVAGSIPATPTKIVLFEQNSPRERVVF